MKNKFVIRSLNLCIFVLLLTAGVLGFGRSVLAADYYVKNGGNDNLDGLSDTTAWATIAKVESTVMNGDTVYFRSQDTWESSTSEARILTSKAGVTYDGSTYGSGTRATFRAMDSHIGSRRGIVGIFESNVTFRGFEIDGNQQVTDGITVGYHATAHISNIAIDDVVVHDNGDPSNDAWLYGILVSSTLGTGTVVRNVSITNSLLYNNGHEGIALYESRLYTNNRTEGILVRNCTVHDTGATTNGNGVGILIANDVDDVTLEYCNLYNNMNGIRVRTSPVYEIPEGNGAPDNMIVRNNYIHDSYGFGISIVNPQGSNPTSPVGMSGDFYNNLITNTAAECRNYYKDGWDLYIGQYHWEDSILKFYNNVFYNTVNNCTNSLGVVSIGRHSTAEGFGGTPIFEFKNNIIYASNFVAFWDTKNRATHSNNLIYRSSGAFDTVAYTSTGTYDRAGVLTWEPTAVSADPQLNNPSNYDFSLQSTSPAIDNGTNSVSSIVTTDFLGTSRPQGAGFDIGAYEYISVGPDLTPPSRSNPQPIGTLTFGTTSTIISLDTDETAKCKYSANAETNYDLMENTFANTNSTNHSTNITNLEDGNSYTYYIRCQDEVGNQNTDDFEISFSIASPSTTYSISNFINLVTDWLKSESGLESDVNGDGVVNTRDLGIMMSNWQ